MSLARIFDALALPPDARVDRRVPKKLLLEQGAPTAADKRKIQDGIDELLWAAALKPSNIGVPVFRNGVREYLEIAVIAATVRAAAKPARLAELIHRAIPYPVLLVMVQGDAVRMSLAHKRWSQGETDRIVLEDLRSTPPLRLDEREQKVAHFLSSLAIFCLPARDLFSLYQGWLDRVVALEVAGITGAFLLPGSGECSAAQRDSLTAHARLQREIVALRARAEKERQLGRRVDLNLEVKRLEAQLAATQEILKGRTP